MILCNYLNIVSAYAIRWRPQSKERLWMIPAGT